MASNSDLDLVLPAQKRKTVAERFQKPVTDQEMFTLSKDTFLQTQRRTIIGL